MNVPSGKTNALPAVSAGVPKAIFVPASVVNVPDVLETGTSESKNVIEFDPTFSAPEERIAVPFMETELVRVTPFELSIVRLLTIAGSPSPVTCATVPL